MMNALFSTLGIMVILILALLMLIGEFVVMLVDSLLDDENEHRRD